MKRINYKKSISILTSMMMAFGVMLQPVFAETGSDESTSLDYVPGEVVVVFEDAVTEDEASDITGEDTELVATDGETSEYAVISDVDDAENFAEELTSSESVTLAQPNYIYEPNSSSVKTSKITSTKDKLGDDQWAFDYMDVPEAWKYIESKVKPNKTDKSKVRVVSLDTGLNTSHEDIQKNVNKSLCVDVTKPTETGYTALTKDKASHGTSAAGVIAATSNNKLGGAGIASGLYNDITELVSVCVFRDGSASSQWMATTADVIEGISYAESIDADVIGMCLGHSRDSKDGADGTHDDEALEMAINEAYEAGITIVSSAGNNNTTAEWLPSDFENTISVIAADKYTNAYGKCKRADSNYGDSKDITAPGTNLKTIGVASKSAYVNFNKTSSATAATTAVVALMKYVNPDLSPDNIREILQETATDLYVEGYDDYTASGLVNAYSAVAAANNEIKAVKATKSGPKKLKASKKTKSKVTLKWKKVDRTYRYEVLKKNKETGNYERVALTKKTKISDTKLKSKTTYEYAVRVIGTTADGKKVTSKMSKLRVKTK